jgi:Uma2 family endonuclease
MTADQFIAWAMEQPEGQRYELVGGEVVAMAPERVGHARAKLRIVNRLNDAIVRAGAPCEAFIDGVVVQADATTVYEPDALVRCGPPLDDRVVRITDPIIVVEVVSPSTRSVDSGVKFASYFRIPSVRHYLLVRMETRTIVHHARANDGTIASRIVSDGALRLDPPGLDLRELFD